jgi:hypothetical protein
MNTWLWSFENGLVRKASGCWVELRKLFTGLRILGLLAVRGVYNIERIIDKNQKNEY